MRSHARVGSSPIYLQIPTALLCLHRCNRRQRGIREAIVCGAPMSEKVRRRAVGRVGIAEPPGRRRTACEEVPFQSVVNC